MSDPRDTRRARAAEPDELSELALDMSWSFNHATDDVWRRLNPELWQATRNPWVVLQSVSRQRIDSMMADARFRQLVEDLVRERRQDHDAPAWFQQVHPDAPPGGVAYFSMEFMLSEGLPIYSGGLGNVAGDQLKTASDLGAPVVGVGLLYQQGYFRQEIDPGGRQRAVYPFNDPGQLPISPVREADGDWLRFPIAFPGTAVWVRAWQVQIGRARLYLLDTNDPANTPSNRGIASELYGGDAELRLKQEIVLGIGGWRMLRAIGLQPEVCHLNEGHAAFAVLERARWYMADRRQPFDVALTVTRAGNVFTTHTPVEAGFDRFDAPLLARYLGAYAERDLAIGFGGLVGMGRRDPRDDAEPFNMAYLAIRGSRAVNGVSRLHGEVSRRLFQPLFPRWPEVEVPVSSVTNGVHMPTWDSVDADRLWEACCGKGRWRQPTANLTDAFRGATDEQLWQLRSSARASFVEYLRERVARQLQEEGAAPAEVARTAAVFDPHVLTVGFARRFAAYKRPNLLLHDPDRLARILTDRQRPMQLVVAGKAHPADAAGRALIEEWTAFLRRSDIDGRVVFLADYDMLTAERLVEGIDLWINTPIRGWEACGTSGMKVLVNGGLNLSELDGWWAEAYAPDVGWAVGDDGPRTNGVDADALYALLEGEVASAFYTRDASGRPTQWLARMRESMARLTPAFSANRALREYVERYYLPAAAAYLSRDAEGGRLGQELLAWRRDLEQAWPTVAFGRLDVEREGDRHAFAVRLRPGRLSPDRLCVELYANAVDGGDPIRVRMAREDGSSAAADGLVYRASVPASRPAEHFTPRAVPCHAAATVPLEAPFILWYDGPR
jgi:glycogen phosphorylase